MLPVVGNAYVVRREGPFGFVGDIVIIVSAETVTPKGFKKTEIKVLRKNCASKDFFQESHLFPLVEKDGQFWKLWLRPVDQKK